MWGRSIRSGPCNALPESARSDIPATPPPVTVPASNAQPIVVKSTHGEVSLCHNGNLINATVAQRRIWKPSGAVFQSSSDSEVILHLLARAEGELLDDALVAALGRVQGAYSLLLLSEGTLIAARDPYGFRPLCIGKFNGSYVVASESCAFDLINASYIREVRPGEVVAINGGEIRSSELPDRTAAGQVHFRACLFRSARQHCFRQDSPGQPGTDGTHSGRGISGGCRSRCPCSRFRESPRQSGIHSGQTFLFRLA